MKSRLAIVGVVLFLWGGAIVARLYHLQVDRHEHYRDRATRQQQRVVEVDGPRGTIFDRRGRELAVSVAVESAYAVPREVTDPVHAASAIARLTGVDGRELVRRLGIDREFVWVARKLDRPVAAKLRALDIPGIYFLEESKRYYPMRELAAHVIGYVGTDDNGLAGLELIHDDAVAGVPVKRTVLRDARRGTALAPELSFADARPGSDLHLTLDATIQHLAERELERVVRKHDARRGSVVVLDVRNGEVLALASWPRFDPNHFGHFDEGAWRNRPIMDAYEPGSTFKIFTAAAALEHDLIAPLDVFDCEMGSITLAGTRISDHKPFGRLTFTEVLAKSSNVGAIKTGLRVGDSRLHAMIRAFGFGAPTGIDLPGESAGIVRPLERWRALSKAYIAFGQEISVTPIQLAAAVGAVANGGRLLRPYVVAGITDPSGTTRRRARPVVSGRPIATQTAQELAGMLETVISAGTAKAAAIPGYAVAGKTGTAQKAEPGGGYSRNKFIASFVGFAPVQAPRLVALVVVDEPRPPHYHGGDVAAPAFSAIVGPSLLYLGEPPVREPLARWPGEPERAEDAAAGTVLAHLGAPAELSLDDTSEGALIDDPQAPPFDPLLDAGAQAVATPVPPPAPAPAAGGLR